MFKYVVYAQNGRGRWHLLRENAQPDKPYFFRTVLSLSHDPDLISGGSKKADNYIQYQGPMYFDLDGEDQGAELVAVIADAKKLVQKLMLEYTLHHQDIQIYLTGGRGLHLEIKQDYFGMTKPQVKLPKIWGAFADKFQSDYIDRSIYSMGRGRMWREPGMQRTNGKFKVQISYDELINLETEEQYDLLCSVPRPALAANEPQTNKYLKAEFDSLRQVVLSEEDEDIHALRDFTNSALKKIKGIPGCVEKLITEGDCADSNWNQAAMQVAAYSAAKYQQEDKDAYLEEIVEPFLNNVESGSRPTYKERKQGMDFLLDRAFSGSIQFFTGALIKTIGKPCGNCEICRPMAGESLTPKEEAEIYMDYPETGILSMKGGTFRLLGDGKKSRIFIEGIQVRQVRLDLHTQDPVAFSLGMGDSRSVIATTEAVNNPRELNMLLNTLGYTTLTTDGDVRMLAQAIMKYHEYKPGDVDVTFSSRLAGIQIVDHKVIKYDNRGLPQESTEKVPYLVARDGVFSSREEKVPTITEFSGRPEWTPKFRDAPQLKEGDSRELTRVFNSLLKINEPFNVMTIIGFMCVAHLRAHLKVVNEGFPLLNLNGTSETGKSSTLFLMHTLNGFEYGKTPVWNAEVDTPYPLEEMISTSSTLVRVIEEVNEGTAKRNWPKLTGILKAAWDSAGIDKGTLSGGKAATHQLMNMAPIVFLSEQPHPVDSVRARSIVCKFKSEVVRDPGYAASFRDAVRGASYLEKLGRYLMRRAMSLSLDDVKHMLEEQEAKLPSQYQARSFTMYSYTLLGLHFLRDSLTKAGVDVQMFERMLGDYEESLREGAKELANTRKESRLDEIVSAFDTMAYERDNPQHGLTVGEHYWRVGNTLYLDPRLVFPRYRRYLRGIGQDQSSSIVTVVQFTDMLEREGYYRGTAQHPSRPQAKVLLLDLNIMAERGISVANYLEGMPE